MHLCFWVLVEKRGERESDASGERLSELMALDSAVRQQTLAIMTLC